MLSSFAAAINVEQGEDSDKSLDISDEEEKADAQKNTKKRDSSFHSMQKKEDDPSKPESLTLMYSPDMYSATFHSMILTEKEKHGLTD